MSISTFAELKTAIANWMERDDQTARIPEFVALAESRIYSALRVREMEASENITVTISTRTSALPTRYAQIRSIYITAGTRLEYKAPEEYWAIHSGRTSAQPDVFTIEGANFVWGPLPDTGYTAVTHFYQIPAAFSADGDTNGVFARWPGLYLSASLLEAATFREDDVDALKWSAMYEDTLEKAMEADRMDRVAAA